MYCVLLRAEIKNFNLFVMNLNKVYFCPALIKIQREITFIQFQNFNNMKKSIYIAAFALSVLLTSCGEEQKKKGIDFNEAKKELTLTADQEKKYDEIVAKYQKIADESRAAATADGAKPDRVEMFKQMEERNKQQAKEMAEFLDQSQLEKYNVFVDQNARKRPRYNDELLAKIKSEVVLDENQAKMLEAANNAFERSYQDAHDLYHGNGELAKEYWDKFDVQRKSAIEKVLTPEQNVKFLELVKDQKYVPRKK